MKFSNGSPAALALSVATTDLGRAAMADATAAASAAADDALGKTMALTYLAVLAGRESKEAFWFKALVKWGMRVMEDDDALVQRFGVSRATLKRWANGDTTPGTLARDSVIMRLDAAIRSKYQLPITAGGLEQEHPTVATDAG